MRYPVNIKGLSSKYEFYKEVIDLHKHATAYLKDFYWCKSIKNTYLYTNVGSVFCVFIFEIDNAAGIEDDFLWIVAGDIPFMYLDTHGPKSTIEVIENYIRLAEDWIYHIKTGRSVKDCFPFRTEETLELAELLERKVAFLKTTLIENIADVEFQREHKS